MRQKQKTRGKILKIKIKNLSAAVLAFIFALSFAESAFATQAVPYITYNYDYREWIVYTPAAYVPDVSISGLALGTVNFSNPQGMCTDSEGRVYIADTGNNRIVVTDSDMSSAIYIIETFINDGLEDSFNGPFGVYVSPDGEIYVADTGNFRLVCLSGVDDAHYGRAVRIIENPQADILGDNFAFAPLKVAADYAGRVYCVARGMFQGLMVFDTTDEFMGFFGTIEVSVTAWQKFWRFFSTKEERANQALFIPTEFTGIDVDREGFIYASHLSTDETGKQAVRRLNPKGEDVIRKGSNEHVGGDIHTVGSSIYAGPSNFIDIDIRENGIYSLLDSRRGRVFTYDHEGNILYIFGGLGSQAGTFRVPAAIASAGTKILVLDAYRAEIQVFKETNYGRLINEAVGLRFDGDEALAVEKWRQTLKYDEAFELANTGIGKSFLTAGDSATAMGYLKLGMSRDFYSIAFKRYRNGYLKQNLGSILTGIVILIFIRFVFGGVKKALRKTPDADSEGSAFEL